MLGTVRSAWDVRVPSGLEDPPAEVDLPVPLGEGTGLALEVESLLALGRKEADRPSATAASGRPVLGARRARRDRKTGELVKID